MSEHESYGENRSSKRRKRKEKKKSKHRKVKKKKYSAESRSPSLSLSSQSPSISESELANDYHSRVLPVEEQINNFRELRSYYNDREQLLSLAIDHLNNEFEDIIPEILREIGLDELKAMCLSELSTLKSNTLRDILGMERASSDDEDLQMREEELQQCQSSDQDISSSASVDKEVQIDGNTLADTDATAVTEDIQIADKNPNSSNQQGSTSTVTDIPDRTDSTSDDSGSDNEVLERKLREKLLRSLLENKKKRKC
ncbi:uncharacterized protein TRIADDRAFT_58836 [Trichoplax adhaerens]|uniref:Uncharacterized protein n=1 Tax=Trichoplax adhaerens TaxID=10228 RepID=B3S3T2_TRIAD|nr:predicted protein [Trichoplax adhaerens]EDV22338.1 predicted protein [Trichoplax adhaerens]|eukprot:XP_002114882.1 predicted protein [Trichoplax adhaerens]